MSSPDKKIYLLELASEAEMVALGRRLVTVLPARVLLTLSGELGTGKSVLARSMIQELGFEGRIKSPTYTLIESYPLGDRSVAHLDLYRLDDPEELQYLGFDDVLAENDVVLVEWPEKAGLLLRDPGRDRDVVEISIGYSGSGRSVRISGLDELLN